VKSSNHGFPAFPLAGPLVPAFFLRRPNRFGAYLDTPDGERYVHVPASGRMGELLVPGARVLYHPSDHPARATRGELLLVEYQGRWVSIEANLAARLAAWLLRSRLIPELSAYVQVQPEVRRGESRLDFRLTGPDLPTCWVEVKSVTLVEDGVACFPDAPTDRGTKHLHELTAAVQAGERAVALFIVQRDDARVLEPNRRTDPAFAAALAAAQAAGVDILCYTCKVEPPTIQVLRRINTKI
jgi:sugar fermentation stimulation protein A